jgi:hypothetical protein
MNQNERDCKERFRRVGEAASDEDAILLLECFRRGDLDMKLLVELATSVRNDLAEIGVFIASELPTRIQSIVPELRHLVGHASPRVRSDMLGVMFAMAAADSSGLYDVPIVAGLADQHVAVRCRALSLMSRWTDERILTAMSQSSANGSLTIDAEEQVEILALVSALRGLDQFFATVDRLSRSKRQRVAAMARHVREWSKIEVDSFD